MGRTRNKKKLHKQPTLRQMKAVQVLSENGGTKGDALLAAGYSASIAASPAKVFGSLGVREILASVGIDEESTGRVLKRNMNARKMRTEYFSRTNKTDEEITQEFEAEGLKVAEIMRYVNDDEKDIIAVRYWAPIYDVSNDALDMANKIMGTYAPTKVDGRFAVGHFSLSKLRKNMEQKGFSVLESENEASTMPTEADENQETA